MKGFVLLYRSLTKDELWTSEPVVNKALAFIDLLLLASYKTGTVRRRNVKIHVEPGDVPYSIRFLSKRWKTSRFFVEKLIGYLSKRGSVKVITEKNTSVIRLLNWDKYQIQPHLVKPPQKTDPPENANSSPDKCSKSQPPETAKSQPPEKAQNELKTKENKASNENLQPPESRNLSHNQQCINTINNYLKKNIQSPDQSGLCALLLQKIMSNYALRRIPPFHKWESVIAELMNDDITFEKIRRVIEFSQDHQYWKSRIRSAISLSNNFGSIYLQMMEAEMKKQKAQTNSPRILT